MNGAKEEETERETEKKRETDRETDKQSKEERQKRMLKADRGRQTDEDAIDRLRKRGARKK